MRFIVLMAFGLLSGCGGLALNTTVADHPEVRRAMLDSVSPGMSEKSFAARWGNPTQKIYEGAQVSYVYRNMIYPPVYFAPHFGKSNDFVVVSFQYGMAVAAYSSDTEGCRATFAPRPPGLGFDNPTTVRPVNCPLSDRMRAGDPVAAAISWLNERAHRVAPKDTPASPRQTPILGVPSDAYVGTLK